MLQNEVAHYGSAAAEIAVCTKAVGLVERPELRLLEVAGDEMLLDHALAPAVPGQVPGPGQARRVAETWCCRVASDRALVAGAAGAVDRWRQVVSRAAATTGIAVASDALSRGEAVSIVGPKASAVLRSSSLPADLAPGAVQERRLAGRGGVRRARTLPAALSGRLPGGGARGDRGFRAPRRARSGGSRGARAPARGAARQRLTFAFAGKYGL
jgi:sarcosine oxidase gamma subunit